MEGQMEGQNGEKNGLNRPRYVPKNERIDPFKALFLQDKKGDDVPKKGRITPDMYLFLRDKLS